MHNAESYTLTELETAGGAAVFKRSHIRLIAIKAPLFVWRNPEATS